MVTSGFFNSSNGDRKYTAEQMSSIFDFLIKPGVLETYGNKFFTTPSTSGLGVVLGSGWAWFDQTWTMNDGNIPFVLDEPDPSLARIDTIALVVNKSQLTRANTFQVFKGLPSLSPTPAPINNTSTIIAHPLAYVTVPADASTISASNIEILVGKSTCPFITSILQTTDITTLFQGWTEQYNLAYSGWNTDFHTSLTAWEAEFNEWFEHLQTYLSEDVVTNLQLQINQLKKADTDNMTAVNNSLALKVNTDDKATTTNAQSGTDDTKWMTPLKVKQAISYQTSYLKTGKIFQLMYVSFLDKFDMYSTAANTPISLADDYTVIFSGANRTNDYNSATAMPVTMISGSGSISTKTINTGFTLNGSTYYLTQCRGRYIATGNMNGLDYGNAIVTSFYMDSSTSSSSYDLAICIYFRDVNKIAVVTTSAGNNLCNIGTSLVTHSTDGISATSFDIYSILTSTLKGKISSNGTLLVSPSVVSGWTKASFSRTVSGSQIYHTIQSYGNYIPIIEKTSNTLYFYVGNVTNGSKTQVGTYSISSDYVLWNQSIAYYNNGWYVAGRIGKTTDIYRITTSSVTKTKSFTITSYVSNVVSDPTIYVSNLGYFIVSQKNRTYAYLYVPFSTMNVATSGIISGAHAVSYPIANTHIIPFRMHPSYSGTNFRNIMFLNGYTGNRYLLPITASDIDFIEHIKSINGLSMLIGSEYPITVTFDSVVSN